MWINTSGTQYINGNQVWWMTLEPRRRTVRLLGFAGGKLTEIGTVESKNYERACGLAESLLKLTELRAGLEKIEFINIEYFSRAEFISSGRETMLEEQFAAAVLTAPDGGTLRIEDAEQIRIIRAYLMQGGRKTK